MRVPAMPWTLLSIDAVYVCVAGEAGRNPDQNRKWALNAIAHEVLKPVAITGSIPVHLDLPGCLQVTPQRRTWSTANGRTQKTSPAWIFDFAKHCKTSGSSADSGSTVTE